MADYGLGSKVDHDYLTANPPPRYMFMFAERETSPDGAPGDEDPILGFRSATTITGTDARFVAGILSGALPSPEHNVTVAELSAGIIGEADRITVKPGIVFNPQSAAGPVTDGSLYFDSDTGELMLYSGGWTALSTGSGMSAHALDGAYHTATGLTIGWVLAADSTTTFSWQAPTGGMSAHDMTGAYHTEDATGGVGNVLRASGATAFAWAALEWGDLDFTTSSIADITTRTHASLSDAPADAHHVAFVLTDFTTAFAAESLANLTTRTHASLSDAPTDAHHTEAHVLATTGPHSGSLPLTDLDSYAQGSVIIGGGTDWQALALGTATYVLKSGALDVSWGQVGFDELTGTLPTHGSSVHDAESDANAIHDNVANEITALTPKTILVSADEFVFEDSEATFGKRAVTFGNLEGSVSLANLGTRTHASLSDAPTDAHHTEGHVLAVTGPHTGELPFADLAAGTRGSLISRGVTDWVELGVGGSGAFLKTDSVDVGWGFVDYSDLIGTQPSPVAHNLIDTTGHPVSGLTGGHFLKATGTTTYAFGAHGLTYSDVGAAPALSGTQWTLPVFDTTTTIGNSIASQDASATYIEIAGAIVTATGQWVAATGAPDGYIWAVSGDYPNYGIYYNSGTPDFLEFHWNAVIKTKFNMEDGAFECAAGDFNVDATGNITDITVAAATVDTDKFLVLDDAQVKFRTGAEVANDIGAATVPLALTDLASYVRGSTIIGGAADWEALALGTSTYVLKSGATDVAWGQVDYSELIGTQPAPIAHVLAATGPHSGELPLTDLASYGQGSIIIGGASDWDNLTAGTEDYVLKMGAAEPAWGQVDWSELVGTQPAPVSHNLVDTTGHPVSSLTIGHVLTALTATTYGFSAPGGGGISGSGTANYHTKWLVGGVSIQDSIISDDGSTATVAGALGLSTGTTVNEFSIDDLLAGASDDAAPTEQAVKAYIDRHTSIGSGNSQWITCPYEGASTTASDIVDSVNCVTPVAGCYLTFTIPLAVSRGGKALWIAASRISLKSADGSNYITNTILRTYWNTGMLVRDTDPTDKNSPALWTDNFLDQNMTLSTGKAGKVHLQAVVGTAGNLQIQFVQVEYYYA